MLDTARLPNPLPHLTARFPLVLNLSPLRSAAGVEVDRAEPVLRHTVGSELLELACPNSADAKQASRASDNYAMICRGHLFLAWH